MIRVDANVLVRYIVRDDARQAAAATRFLESTLGGQQPAFIDNIVLCELFWVLESGYGYTRADIAATLQRLLEIDRFRFETPELAWQALDAYRNGADFADTLLARVNEAARWDYTATLDQRAATRIESMRLLTR